MWIIYLYNQWLEVCTMWTFNGRTAVKVGAIKLMPTVRCFLKYYNFYFTDHEIASVAFTQTRWGKLLTLTQDFSWKRQESLPTDIMLRSTGRHQDMNTPPHGLKAILFLEANSDPNKYLPVLFACSWKHMQFLFFKGPSNPCPNEVHQLNHYFHDRNCSSFFS